MSEDKPGREDGSARPSGPDGADADGGLSDEQIDRETPGVDDAGELEAAEAEIAGEAHEDEDKVVSTPAGRRRRSAGRPANRTPERTGEGTRSRAAAERARAAELREKRNLGRFLREVVAELRKVIWPGRRELITYTTVVIIFVTVMVALVAGLDILFAKGVVAIFG
ncbi:preprotein translocase subunit SecE [Modestobacter lapidis]|nr:preprotein translocase subunit SecE [Modestobacter lapidis]